MQAIRRLLVLVLVLVLVLAAPARAAEDSPMTVVFVIDGSGSMEFTDPGAFRRDAVKAFIDLVAEDVGSVAVTQFAGWTETKARGDAVVPLTKLPSPGPELDKVLDGVRKAIDEKVQPFGEATDFSRALGEGLAPILQAVAGEKDKKVWIIFFTDGDSFEVLEPGGTRQEYVDAAKARGADPNDFEAMNGIALEEFQKKTVPALNRDHIFVTPILLQQTAEETQLSPVLQAIVDGTQNPGKVLRVTAQSLRTVFLEALNRDHIFITPILLQQTAEETQLSPVLQAIVDGTPNPGKVLRVTAQSLRTVFLEALAGVPTSFLRSRATKGFDYKADKVAPKGEAGLKFRRFPFATMTRAIVFSESPQLEIDVSGPDGKSVKSSEHVRIVGRGARYRIVSIDHRMPAGDYALKITSGAEKPATIERLWFATIDAQPKLEIPEESEPGTEMSGRVSLLAPDGKVITDPQFLDGLEVVLTRTDPKSQRTELVAPRFAKEASAPFKDALGIDIPFGAWHYAARFRALKRQGPATGGALQGGDFAFESEIVVEKTMVRATVKLVAAPAEALLGESVEVTATLAGRVLPKGLTVTLAPAQGDALLVELSREGQSRDLKGKVTPPAAGEWKLEGTSPDPVKFVVETPVVKIAAREIALLDEQGDKVEKIELPLKWEEASSAAFKGKLTVGVKAGESAAFAIEAPAFAGAGPEDKLTTSIDTTPSPKGEAGLEVGATQDGSGEVSAKTPLKASVTIGEVKLSRDFPVEITYPDKAAKEFRKFLIIMGIILLLLLLAALIAYLLYRRARFEKHCLVLVGPNGEKKAVHLLAEKVGLRGGKAPPEAPGVLDMLAIGKRGATRAQGTPGDPKTPVLVNDQPWSGARELKDGDRITFQKDGQSYTYLYFSGDVPADLSAFLPKPKETAPVDGDQEIIIDFS